MTSLDITMTSMEVAEITNRSHKGVLRSIRNMFSQIEAGNNDAPGTLEAKYSSVYTDANNQERPMYILTKDMAYTLMTGLNTELRYRMITYINQLERETALMADALTNVSNATSLIKAKGIARTALDIRVNLRLNHKNHCESIAKHTESLSFNHPDMANMQIQRLATIAATGHAPCVWKRATGMSPRELMATNYDVEGLMKLNAELSKAELLAKLGYSYQEIREQLVA